MWQGSDNVAGQPQMKWGQWQCDGGGNGNCGDNDDVTVMETAETMDGKETTVTIKKQANNQP